MGITPPCTGTHPATTRSILDKKVSFRVNLMKQLLNQILLEKHIIQRLDFTSTDVDDICNVPVADPAIATGVIKYLPRQQASHGQSPGTWVIKKFKSLQ